MSIQTALAQDFETAFQASGPRDGIAHEIVEWHWLRAGRGEARRACGAAGIALGAVVEFLFIRRFAKAPRLILTVATIGIAAAVYVSKRRSAVISDEEPAPVG